MYASLLTLGIVLGAAITSPIQKVVITAPDTCGTDGHSGASKLALSAFIGGASRPLPLGAAFSPTTCDYTVDNTGVSNLITVNVMPEAIGGWQSFPVAALHVNGETVQCYSGEGKCDSRSVLPDEPIIIQLQIWNNTNGGPATWSSTYTVTPGTPPGSDGVAQL
eukprot:gene2035-25729_t